MEVDDAVNATSSPAATTITTTATQESPTPPPPENGRSASRHSSRRHVPTPKALAMVETEKDDAPEVQAPPLPKAARKAKPEKTEEVKEELDLEASSSSILTATPLKLHVSDDEDEEDEMKQQEEKMDVDEQEKKGEQEQQTNDSRPRKSRRDAARRQLLASPRVAEGDRATPAAAAAQETEAGEEEDEDDEADVFSDKADGSGGVALKRKRYEVRRSGSEECLLGFDEQSGEAELVKNDEGSLLTPSPTATATKIVKEDKDKDKEEYEKQAVLQPLPSPSTPPRSAKRMKKNPIAKSPSPQSSKTPPAVKSPPQAEVKVEVQEETAVATSLNSEEDIPVPAPLTPEPQEQQLPAKPHIVGDNEETNGGATSTPTNKAAISTAALPQTPIPAAAGTAAAAAAVHVSTPLPKSKPISAQDDFYKKPFEYGWRRELVWRANMETSKDKADVYFITPAGKKLRTRSEIAPLLDGDLTLDHFSFAREPLGVAPELELVRSAKPSTRVSVTAATLAAAASTPTSIGKRVSKPKGPKGASPPPQGWTPTRALKVNNAALLCSASSSRYGGGFGGGGPSTASSASSRASAGGGSSGSAGSSKSSKAKKASSSSSSSGTNVDHSAGVGAASAGASSHDPCSTNCTRAPGEVPQLQCVKCLCLFHSECVGPSGRIKSKNSYICGYICEACLPSSSLSSATEPAVKSADKTAAREKQHPPLAPQHPVPARTAGRAENKFPQTIAVVKGKKYVMVAKPIATTATPAAKHANDIENDLKQINESIRNSRKPSLISMDAAFQPHAQTAAAGAPVVAGVAAAAAAASAAVEHSNKLFATNFFANVSFAYDALICILKYLKIHERPRAASVCKLWHLAAKDTSLWHTVRMKNSKVCNWAGFTAALRRGETKQLDLRKMLLASTRSDEMWQDFALHIGTVCSLEVIDLCRCSARVVEGLFQSNKQLRVLNAVAINDDTINLEHIGLLTGLEELRLRTCEAAVLAGDLQPLQSLSGLAHLSLTSIRGLGAKTLNVLGDLTALRSLELGECGEFDEVFAETVLPRLLQLQRLRLENGQETGCCTLAILNAAAQLQQLSQLELVNFDIKPGFDEKLCQCRNIRKLLIIPTYISQSATTNHIVLSAVQQVSDTLQVFTWGVTVELLRVTALYVDQCEESTKKEKHHFDECIPVLKPVPGAPPAEEDDDEDGADGGEKKKIAPPPPPPTQPTPSTDDPNAAASEVPQIEILPLDKVEFILGENLPHTKFTIVKVPYHATCKQQLVE